MAESIEQLSFELSVSALSEQERALAGLRTCAGTVLAAASIAGSFLGAQARNGSLDAWAIAATVSFALCVGSAIWVLLPRELVLAFGGEELLAQGDHQGMRNVVDAYRAAAAWIEPNLHVNRHTIDKLADWLSASCTLLAIEVISWTLSFTG